MAKKTQGKPEAAPSEASQPTPAASAVPETPAAPSEPMTAAPAPADEASQIPAGSETTEAASADGSQAPVPTATVEAPATQEHDTDAGSEIVAEVLQERFPLTVAALDARRAAGQDMPEALRVTAKVAGFRRAGIEHAASPTEHEISSLTPEQLEALLEDAAREQPNLVVEFI